MKSKGIIYFIGLLLLLSCENEENLRISLGDNFINSETTVALVDTMAVQLSTFKLDSIATSGCGYALVGKYSDSYFGELSSTAYLQLGLPASSDVDEEEIFDSICIELPYSGMSYGDTLSFQTISLHRVLENIEAHDEDDTYLYNTSSFPYDSKVLGDKTFKAKPNKYDELEIRLSDELGLDFLAMLKDNDDGINATSDFVEYFKGLALVADKGNSAVFSFTADTTLKVMLYTHMIGEEKIEKSYSFTYNTSLVQFNNITSDVSGLPIEALRTQREEIGSEELGDMAYLQAGMGFVTRVDIPSLGKVLEVDRKNYLYKAVLVLRPVRETSSDVPLPEKLILYTTDKYNNLVSEITDEDGYSIYADFYYDEYFNEDSYYSFDVTDYLYGELADNYVDTNNGLLVMLSGSEYTGTLSRVVFDGRSGLSYRSYLNLYYVFYD